MHPNHELIRAKMDVARNMDFSNWTPRRVAEHLIAAGKRRQFKQPRYDFPGYYHFPYHIWANSEQREVDLPFKYSDHDAILKSRYMILGELEFQSVQREYHAYLFELIVSTIQPREAKKPQNAQVPVPATNRSDIPVNQMNSNMATNVASAVTHGLVASDSASSIPENHHPLNIAERNVVRSSSQHAGPIAHSSPLPIRPPAQSIPDQIDLEDIIDLNMVTNVSDAAPIANASAVQPIVPEPNTVSSLATISEPLLNSHLLSNAAVVPIEGDFGQEDQQALQQVVRQDLNLPEGQDQPEHVLRIGRILSQEQRDEPQPDPTIEDIPIRRRIINARGRLARRGAKEVHRHGNIESIPVLEDIEAVEVPIPPTQNVIDVQSVQQLNLDDLEITTNDQPGQPDVQPEVQPDIQPDAQPNATPDAGNTQAQNVILPTDTLPELETEIDLQPAINENIDANMVASSGQRPVRDTPLLNRAIRRLGRNRQTRPATRKIIGSNMIVPIDASMLEVSRQMESSFEYHPRIEPGLDLAMFYERVLEMLHESEYVTILAYTDTWNTQSQRNNALTALCTMATDGIVKIKIQDLSADAPNQKIAGFELRTFDSPTSSDTESLQ